jgi:RNA polymerase sigma-70 factor (sigma-E family)
VDFDRYIADHGDALLRHATVVSADPHTAKDLVQTVLERAYRRWASIADLEYPDAYLRRMVINEFVSSRRRLARVVPLRWMPEPAPGPDHADQQSDRITLIGELRRLAPQQRAALALRYWDGLSDAQIAAELGCSESTVRGYILRALRRMRVDLDGHPGLTTIGTEG